MAPKVCLALLVAVPAVSAQTALVQAVEVRLVIVDGGAPRVVQARLQDTLETIAQRLLVGRPVDQLRQARAPLAAALTTVLDRVVGGYGVLDATVQGGTTATVVVRLRAEPPLIARVEAELRTGVQDMVAPLVLGPVERSVVPAVRRLLLGLPVEALDWAAPLLGEEIQRLVEAAVPGFTAGVRIVPRAQARVELALAPRDTRIVRDVGVRFRSSSIPALLLEQHAPQVLSIAEPIRGLPVVFLEAHRAALERLLDQRLRTYAPAARYEIVARTVLRVGEQTYITVVADSAFWLARLEAVVSAGTGAPDAEIRAHVGRLVGGVELFGEIRVVPNRLGVRADVGGRYPISPSLDLGATHALNASETWGWVIYRLNPDLSVRGAFETQRGTFEGSVRYRFTEVLAGEIVGTSEGRYWLRVISNL